jgi:hypothetical protein
MNKHTPSEPMSPGGARSCAARATMTCIRFTTCCTIANYKGQVQAWALTRYVYQAAIPRKDASLNCDVHRRDLECPVYVDSSRPVRPCIPAGRVAVSSTAYTVARDASLGGLVISPVARPYAGLR